MEIDSAPGLSCALGLAICRFTNIIQLSSRERERRDDLRGRTAGKQHEARDEEDPQSPRRKRGQQPGQWPTVSLSALASTRSLGPLTCVSRCSRVQACAPARQLHSPLDVRTGSAMASVDTGMRNPLLADSFPRAKGHGFSACPCEAHRVEGFQYSSSSSITPAPAAPCFSPFFSPSLSRSHLLARSPESTVSPSRPISIQATKTIKSCSLSYPPHPPSQLYLVARIFLHKSPE